MSARAGTSSSPTGRAPARDTDSCCRTGSLVPDPASRHQPRGCARAERGGRPRGLCLAATPAGSGRPWEEAVLYELHVGAFTPEGTFRAAIDKLDHLVALGVTAIEIMPVGDFPGPPQLGL